MSRAHFLIALCVALMAHAAAGQELATDGVECLPNEANQFLVASVDPEIRGSDQVRLHFRRLNPTGAFYWVEMNPSGEGSYWAVFPKPEQREQPKLTDEWWEILQSRDWMEGRDREWLEDYLDEQDFEAAEYYVSAVDVEGKELGRTSLELVEIQKRDECTVALDPYHVGQLRNLTVGETTEAQKGKEVFHWLCDGIVSRVDFEGILREDEYCRGCVVAAWPAAIPGAAGVIAGTTIDRRRPRPASEVQPGN